MAISNDIGSAQASTAEIFGGAILAKATTLWRNPVWLWVLLLAAAAVLSAAMRPALEHMVDCWLYREEYSHAIFLPVIAAFLVWQKHDLLARLPFSGSWLGFAVMLLGAALLLAGLMSTLFVIQQYALILIITALVLSFVGTSSFRYFIVPLIILLLTIPLPNFFYNNLSSELQLLSSQLGVGVIRAFGIPVFLEGNVIDLGQMQLQVVDACAGLRYLFPLVSLGFVVAHFFSVPLWMRVITVLSTIPITVLMNSARIGLIGVSVEYWGRAMAEGVLHDFEGWVVFMASLAVLLLEMWLMVKLVYKKARLAEVFVVDLPAKIATGTPFRVRSLPRPFVASLLLVPAIAAVGLSLNQREEIIPSHKPLTQFPMQIGEWHGEFHTIDALVLKTLKLTDYFQIDYRSPTNDLINFYVAYYASQRAGESAHSPRSCIPGGGWRIVSIDAHTLSANDRGGQPLTVQRLLIQKGNVSQLVYYWFDQRGRVLTNEILVKWYLLQDALLKNRSDGSLVRVLMPISGIDAESIAHADQTLERFLSRAEPELQQFLPQ